MLTGWLLLAMRSGVAESSLIKSLGGTESVIARVVATNPLITDPVPVIAGPASLRRICWSQLVAGCHLVYTRFTPDLSLILALVTVGGWVSVS
jgi:hypothetical protein